MKDCGRGTALTEPGASSEAAVATDTHGGRPRAPLARLFEPWGLLLLALGGGWLLFVDMVRGEWAINPQYNYGYAVPLVCAVLFWRRWPDRPPGRPVAFGWAGALAIGGLVLLHLPLRVVQEANPEWRLLYWMGGLQMVTLTLAALYAAGGGWWVRYFLVPVLFVLLAVPWPMGFELAVTQNLMRLVTSLTVEVTTWLGIPAVQHGNLIEVGQGVVGVDEACSGVRSLQSALMMSLLLGELYQLTRLRRLSLVAGSIGFVLVANLTRTVFLVHAAARRGLHEMESLHDTAGLLVMLIVLPGLLALALLLRSRAAQRPLPKPPAPGSGLPALPRWVGLLALAWLGAVELTTAAWYRAHEVGLPASARWSVAWPAQSPAFKRSPLPANSLAILRCSNSESASWQDAEGNLWSAFFLRWEPGKNSAQLAKGHRPEICLPAAGATLREDFGQLLLPARELRLPFRHQTFESGSRLFHVFYCLWSDRASSRDASSAEDGTQASRLRATLAGERHLGQQVLEIVLQGPDSQEEALALLQSQLPSLIRPD